MKKFKFSLDKVLMHRKLQTDLAQKDFIEAQNNLSKEEAALADMIAMKEGAIKNRYETVQHSQNWSASIEQINSYLTGQDLRIVNQNKRLLDFIKLVEVKREILQEALTAAKILEKLREKKKEEFFREVAKLEQQELDEMSVMRFSRNENLKS
ncbi:MAG: flagellar export protein FliJ [Pseudobdellovibrio sp.]